MEKKTIFMVRNSLTGEILDKNNEWSRAKYGLAVFDDKATAEAAFPSGVRCSVVQRTERVES